MYAEQVGRVRRERYRMELAIATNPHLKEQAQRKLWSALENKRVAPVKTADQRRKDEAKVLEAMLKKAGKCGV